MRFCPYRAEVVHSFYSQGVASLALGYALVGLSARYQQEQHAQLEQKTFNDKED